MESPIIFSSEMYEKLFKFLFQSSRESILFIDKRLIVIDANQNAIIAFKIPHNKIIGTDFQELIDPKDRDSLYQICAGMGENAGWKGTANGLDGDGEIFPMELVIKRIGDGEQFHCCVTIMDLREKASLKERLDKEKSHRREMYITLRNVMSSVEKEKAGFERLIAHKIETMLLPALDKAKRESLRDIQNGYLHFIREQLLGLTKTFPRELDIGFVRLTRSEMKICQYLQAGYSSKEIADALNISFETIQTHRKNIRRKLGLHGKKISLYTFLSTRRKLGKVV